jgi:hypothetical protein
MLSTCPLHRLVRGCGEACDTQYFANFINQFGFEIYFPILEQERRYFTEKVKLFYQSPSHCFGLLTWKIYSKQENDNTPEE